MKTTITNDNTVYRSYKTDILSFGMLIDNKIQFKSVSITLSATDFKVNKIIEPQDWFKSMIQDKLFVTNDTTLDQYTDITKVEHLSIDYILLTLLRILKVLSPEVTINSLSYEIH